MKKYCLFIGFFLLLAIQCPAQQLYPLDTATDSLRIRVVAAQNRLALEWLDREPDGKGRKRDFMTITDLRLDDADLVLAYAPEKMRKDFLLSVGLSLRSLDDDEIFDPKPSETLESDLPTGKQITLLDGTERSLELGRTYILYVRKTLLGPVPCDKPRPVFSTARQLPYYGMAIAGFTLVGLGIVYDQQKVDARNRYVEYWKEGKTATDARVFYDTAKKQEKKARIYTSAGLAIIGLDAFFYTRKWFRVRDRQRIYDQFCGKKTTELGFSPRSFGGSGVGMGLTFSW